MALGHHTVLHSVAVLAAATLLAPLDLFPSARADFADTPFARFTFGQGLARVVSQRDVGRFGHWLPTKIRLGPVARLGMPKFPPAETPGLRSNTTAEIHDKRVARRPDLTDTNRSQPSIAVRQPDPRSANGRIVTASIGKPADRRQPPERVAKPDGRTGAQTQAPARGLNDKASGSAGTSMGLGASAALQGGRAQNIGPPLPRRAPSVRPRYQKPVKRVAARKEKKPEQAATEFPVWAQRAFE